MSMNEAQRVGEVIEASTTDFVAQCYELYQLPPLGSLVKTRDSDVELYGVVCQATTTSFESGRRPIARGKEEASEEAIYQANPQLTKLLKPYIESEKGTDVRIKPKLVVEVAYEEIQKSPNYSSGYALRFPRVVRIRLDREAKDSDTVERVRKLHEMQRGRQK